MLLKKAFWFHYNKPMSARRGQPILTIHYGGVCHFVTEIDCKVPVKTRIRKSQPRCVMAGKGNLEIVDGRAVIK
jgi:hypothetical protein